MQETDRQAFEVILAELFAALDKPLSEAQRVGFWKGLQRMSIVEFSRCRDQMLAELSEGEAPRKFGVADVWAAKRRLRAPAPESTPKEPEWQGDDWDIAANNHLLAHILRQRQMGVHYADPETAAMRRRANQPTEESRELTAPLVAYKKAWAQDCREYREDMDPKTGEYLPPPVEVQKRWWNDCMRRAEERVNQVRAKWAAQRMNFAA